MPAERELAELEVCRDGRAAAENVRTAYPDTAAAIHALVDATERFQRLWIDTVETMRDYEVRPLGAEIKRLQNLLATESTERMEEALAVHYGEPVRPVSRYCAAFETWHRLIKEAIDRGDFDGNGQKERWEQIVAALGSLQIPIRKSNLLWRLIYTGLRPGTTKCPEHHGHWSGCPLIECPHGCTIGGNTTGWLP